MPPADEIKGTPPAKMLLYGKGKTKKTWWVIDAVRAGYVVVVLDGDNSTHIIEQMELTAEEKSRLLIIDLVDKSDRAVFTVFMAMFSRKGSSFLWDEQDKRMYIGMPKPGHSYIKVEAALLPRNVIISCDSWTALCRSTLFKFAAEHQINLDDAAKVEWDGYGFESRYLDHVLNFLRSLNCHVMVVAHSYVYEKRSKDGKTIVSQNTQPISSSGRHGGNLIAQFSDVLFFTKLSGTAFFIDTQGSADVDGGCRLIPPGVYEWSKMPLAPLIAKTGDGKPTFNNRNIPGLTWIAPMTEEEIAALPQPAAAVNVSSLVLGAASVSATPPAERTVVSASPKPQGGSSILASLGVTIPTPPSS